MASVEAEDLEQKNNFRAALEDAVDLDVGQPVETEGKVHSDFAYGQDSPSSAGTPVALNGGNSLSVPPGGKVRVLALPSNSGTAYVGDSNVSSSNGFALSPGDELQVRIDDVSKLYVDADNAGEGVSWMVEQ